MNFSSILRNSFFIRGILIILILLSLAIFLWLFYRSNSFVQGPSPSPVILGETRTAIVISPVPTPTPSPSPSPTPLPSTKPLPKKQSYVIAAFGDSMVDTMGENLDYLDKSLRARYPQTQFKFYNYGIGSQNVVEANKRFSEQFHYKTRNYPPISELKPDIIIVSSFAYNPIVPNNPNLYWENLRNLVRKSKETGANVYLLVDLAPLKEGFGKGVGGVNWDEDKTREHVGLIIQNIDNAVSLSAQTKTPLINVYKNSQVDGKYGNKIYISSHDGIHPSIEGEIFMADLIAETIKLD